MKTVIKQELPIVDHAPVEDFCINERCCKERYPSQTYPSPTSCLPLEQLKELKAKIARANRLLLDLALDNDRTPEEIFRNAFNGLEGLMVEVDLEIGSKLLGKVDTVGFDFCVLLDEEGEVVLPYRQIIKVKPSGRYAEPDKESSQIAIESCFRRDLTYYFGEVVASSPMLIQLFFGMRFNIFLLLVEARKIEITLDGETIEGFVTDINKETIVVKVGKDIKVISFNKIAMVKIK
ncbi:hypothetical protein [Ornithinibacillus californiensis]|uniref:hypothetical protein n=1 Tax=Ornithinibacillus californiensis TaxID=161536 RepID=UPI00064DFC28|nr:hypothetical protein [Ornithinibacillus californiensis]